jgi:hypothetical protein
MTQFLVLTLGIPAPTAIGTDVVYATFTRTVGSVQHYRQISDRGGSHDAGKRRFLTCRNAAPGEHPGSHFRK